MQINSDRLWKRLHAIGEIGKDPDGGISRFSWTTEYRKACVALMDYARKLNLSVRMDTVGNMFFRLEGQNKELPAVLMGSHFDTVPHGGCFDGIAGVMAGMEVLETLMDQGFKPERSVEVVAFVNEEGTQFLGGTFGSRAVCGMIQKEYVEECRDHYTGQRMKDAMLAFDMGLEPDHVEKSKIRPEDYCCFIELHIEQGRHLLDSGYPVAVVTDIAGIQQMYVELTGVACHAGGMAMRARKDALMAAAHLACEVEHLALYSGGKDTRATVGYIKSKPGVHNIVADFCEVPIDFREDNDEIYNAFSQRLEDYIHDLCNKRGIGYRVVKTLELHPAHSDPKIVETMLRSAEELEIPYTQMVSYPCHDAVNMERIMPMGMIFLRSSNGGVSHCPEEYTTQEDLTAGANILLHTILKLAY